MLSGFGGGCGREALTPGELEPHLPEILLLRTQLPYVFPVSYDKDFKKSLTDSMYSEISSSPPVLMNFISSED